MSKLSDRIGNMEWGFPSPGGIDKNDCEILENFVVEQMKKVGPAVKIADVGCWTGKSTVSLALPGKEVSVTAIDWFKGSDGTELAMAASDVTVKDVLLSNLRYFDVLKQVNIIEDTSAKSALQFADHTFDIVFIDADHRYLEVEKDLLAWFSKVKPGGILCGHDCEFILKSKNDWNFFNDVTDNPWNDSDYLRFHPGVVRAVSKHFPKALIMGQQIWMVQK